MKMKLISFLGYAIFFVMMVAFITVVTLHLPEIITTK